MGAYADCSSWSVCLMAVSQSMTPLCSETTPMAMSNSGKEECSDAFFVVYPINLNVKLATNNGNPNTRQVYLHSR